MRAPVTALLGPTNTGKTHLALEHMLRHRSGLIGFPLRLLARENYDKLVRQRGAEQVALITGEERVVPANPRYTVATVEAMPLDKPVDFLAVDEVQLAADRERGHVFTDRILHARGRTETLLLGASTMRPLLEKLLPEAAFISRPRLSTLTYVPPKRLNRLPRRSAVIAFSLPQLYELAERLRRECGGVAVVFGALSPRTRNAQVAMYQAGEVDYLVATDAIGMGLNLDIDHVTFTSLTKFDGQGPRNLRPAEIAQIAGRAGRHLKDGTFSPTTELGPFDERLVSALESHRFEPVESLYWRSPELDYTTPAALLASLEARPPIPELVRMKTADDHVALDALARDPEVRARLRGPDDVRRLWDVCQVPDFRSVMHEGHTRLLARIFTWLSQPPGELPDDWVGTQVAALDRADGDIDTLLVRIAGIRTWTYVSHRPSWLRDPEYWRQRTRAVEDRLSDALHERLTEQFVDRRAALIARSDPGEIVSAVSEADEVLIQGLRAGRMDGFVFVPEPGLKEDARALLAAANRAVREGAADRVRQLVDEPDAAFALSATGQVMWRSAAVARLVAGDHALSPKVEVQPSELLDPALREKVRRRLAGWIEAEVRRQLGPLVRAREADLSGVARGLAFVVADAMGTVERRAVAAQVAGLDADDRRELQRVGLSVGRLAVWTPALRADSIPLRALLWRLRRAGPVPTGEHAPRLPDGRASVPAQPSLPAAFENACGYLRLGPRAVRVDRAEHLAATAGRLAREGPFAAGKPLADIAGCSPGEIPALLQALGYVPAGEGLWTRSGGRRTLRRA